MSSIFSGDVAARIASRMLEHDHIPDDADELFSMSLRVPESMRAMVDAMAQQVGVSRNSMGIDLLRAGIQNVLSNLPPEVAQDLIEEAGGLL